MTLTPFDRTLPWLLGNWKMNGDLEALEAFDEAFAQKFGRGTTAPNARMGLALPDLLLYPATGLLSNLPISLGVQTASSAMTGAHTGETSPQLAAQMGASFVVLGHSERRADQGETSALISAKAEAALAAGLTPVICIGETLAEREAGKAKEVTLGQLEQSLPKQDAAKCFIAYEPVWAIGTGVVATPEQAQDMHALIRKALPDPTMPVLYGGSMKGSNSGELLAQPDIDGGLIGGASLKPADFLAIYQSCP